MSNPRPRHALFLFLFCLAFCASWSHAATVTTLPATSIANFSATLNGVANPGGFSAQGFFQYGTTTNYGTTTALQGIGGGNSNTNFSQFIGGLSGGQTYHFRAGMMSLFMQIFGSDQSFYLPGPPAVTTVAASPIHPGQATLNATINPNGLATFYWFQHGPTTNYGSFTPTNSLAAGTNLLSVSNLVTALPRGVTYHFSVVASNVLGLSVGADMSFTVPAGPTGPSGSTGGGALVDIREPSLELNFLICTNGFYPSTDVPIPFTGEICVFAGNAVPAGWALCQGQLVNINSNTALFSLIGTIYGGDGVTNFALPDFRGRRAVDIGQGPGLSSWVEGEQFGVAQESLLVQQIPAHTHSLPPPDSATGTTGGGQPHGILQPSLAVSYLFVPVGFFPIQTNAIFEPFLGQILMFGGGIVPQGTYQPNGQAEPITQNEALYAVIGTNYGGDGVNTFDLPDLRSRSPLGTGQGPITLWSLAQKAGAENVTMTVAQLPAHQHTVPSLGIMTGFTGSNQPQSLIEPSLAIQCIICTNGQIPSPTVEATNAMIGEIQYYAGTNVPTGWLPCDGRTLQVTNAPQLFGVISNLYGGDGVTTFVLPNLFGRTAVGSMTGQPGASYGAEQVVLTVAQLPPHTHTAPVLDFDRWITSFGLSGNVAGFSADADSDQGDNGYEWATGTNPTNAHSLAPLTITAAGGNAVISFPRNTNATDVVFTLQCNKSLTNAGAWSGIATNVAGVWSPSGIVSESGATNPLSVSIFDALTNASSANYRLQITWP